MRAYFRKRFTAKERENDPIKLKNALIFLESLQLVSTEEINVGPPDKRTFSNHQTTEGWQII